MSLSPYYLQTEADPGASLSRNFGGQLTFSMPLDFTALNSCKELAKRQLEKERLDYELVRIKECIGIYKSGFTIDPRSSFYQICADVIPLSSVADATKSSEEASSES